MKEYLASKISTRNNYLVILAVFIAGLTGFLFIEIFNEDLAINIYRQVLFVLALILNIVFAIFIFKFIFEIEADLNKLKR